MPEYITYFDEVKANPGNGQLRYLVGGIAVPLSSIARIEEQMNNLAREVFGRTDLAPDTEFHASHIYFGKGPFKGRLPDERIAILAALGRILNSDPEVRRVYAAINTEQLYPGANAPETAFAYFCERVQMLAGPKGTSLIIGDLDDAQAKQMIRDFATYRARGTPWTYGISIKSIVDAVHFVRSHHSRMVQLADVYLFLLSHRWGTRQGWMADRLNKEIVGVSTWAHRYKEWPNR